MSYENQYGRPPAEEWDLGVEPQPEQAATGHLANQFGGAVAIEGASAGSAEPEGAKVYQFPTPAGANTAPATGEQQVAPGSLGGGPVETDAQVAARHAASRDERASAYAADWQAGRSWRPGRRS